MNPFQYISELKVLCGIVGNIFEDSISGNLRHQASMPRASFVFRLHYLVWSVRILFNVILPEK